MPIRGHSGVQGGAEMGAYATAFPGNVPIAPESARALAERYGFPVPGARGLTAEEMIEAAGRGELDVLYASGGNFLDVLPDPRLVAERLARVPVRVHQDIVVSSQMLVDPPPGGTVVLLPAATRYEQPGGGTQTTTERRIAFSPEIPGPRPGEARAEWQIYLELARRVAPERAGLVGFSDAQEIREEIAQVVPFYDGVQHLRTTGDQVQWGGPRLCEGWVFPTPDGKAHFHDVAAARPPPAGGALPALLAPRQAVQLDGVRRPRPAHRRRARRPVHLARGRGGAGAGRGRAGAGALGHRRDRGPRPHRRACAPATCRCSGPSATR